MINLPEEDPYAVEAMMHYFYYLDYLAILLPFSVAEPSLELNGLELVLILDLMNHPPKVPTNTGRITKALVDESPIVALVNCAREGGEAVLGPYYAPDSPLVWVL